MTVKTQSMIHSDNHRLILLLRCCGNDNSDDLLIEGSGYIYHAWTLLDELFSVSGFVFYIYILNIHQHGSQCKDSVRVSPGCSGQQCLSSSPECPAAESRKQFHCLYEFQWVEFYAYEP